MSEYRLYVSNERTDHTVRGTSPAKALRQLVSAAGLSMRAQDGRYGTLEDGRTVSALTVPWSRRSFPDARTTRGLS